MSGTCHLTVTSVLYICNLCKNTHLSFVSDATLGMLVRQVLASKVYGFQQCRTKPVPCTRKYIYLEDRWEQIKLQ